MWPLDDNKYNSNHLHISDTDPSIVNDRVYHYTTKSQCIFVILNQDYRQYYVKI